MKELLEVKILIDKIAETSSRNEKEAILKDYKAVPLFREILYFVYSPYILTGISKKKISKQVGMINGFSKPQNIKELMDYLRIHNSGRDVDISTCECFYTNFDNELQDFIKKIVTKDVVIGITADSINKAFGEEFIPTFDVMLAKKYDEHKDKVKGNFVITQKLDGNRIVLIKENGLIKTFTRQGKQYEGLEEIESDFKDIPIDNIVFDGELIADVKGSTHEIYTETTSKARSKGSNKTGLLFYVFDVLPLKEFQSGKSNLNAIQRKLNLSDIFNKFTLQHCIEVKPLYTGSDVTQIDKWMEYANQNAWEGLMINLDKPYVCKRTDSILKVKGMNTCDLKVIGFEEGTGRNEGKLGALLVGYKGYTVGVGSGFTDADRDYIWNHLKEYDGKIVEIQYFEESKNQDGGLSLRFPVFLRKREEGKEVSYN
jgi:DNA ligase-1